MSHSESEIRFSDDRHHGRHAYTVSICDYCQFMIVNPSNLDQVRSQYTILLYLLLIILIKLVNPLTYKQILN